MDMSGFLDGALDWLEEWLNSARAEARNTGLEKEGMNLISWSERRTFKLESGPALDQWG